MFTEIFKTDNTPKLKNLLCRGKRGMFKVLQLSLSLFEGILLLLKAAVLLSEGTFL